MPAGSSAALSSATAVNPTFAIDVPGTYIVQLMVNDGTTASQPDTVIISTENSPPAADAGADQAVRVNDTVHLDGSSSSDADGDTLTFKWSFTSMPAGSSAALSSATAVNPTFYDRCTRHLHRTIDGQRWDHRQPAGYGDHFH